MRDSKLQGFFFKFTTSHCLHEAMVIPGFIDLEGMTKCDIPEKLENKNSCPWETLLEFFLQRE